MSESQNNRRFWEVMIGLFFLIFGLAAVGGGEAAFMPIVLGLLGFWLLAKQFDRSKANVGMSSASYDEGDEMQTASRSPGAEQVYSHAVQAVRRAGRDPNDTQVLPVEGHREDVACEQAHGCRKLRLAKRGLRLVYTFRVQVDGRQGAIFADTLAETFDPQRRGASGV